MHASRLSSCTFKGFAFVHLRPFYASNTMYQDCAGTCIRADPDLAACAPGRAMCNATAVCVDHQRRRLVHARCFLLPHALDSFW
eukprot:m.1268612 g.1268612  ORF g.1268612 m.1268612 type:complete len:84 (+) comp24746_c0_seq1:2884-3135(+)